jgi:hypothetical protein
MHGELNATTGLLQALVVDESSVVLGVEELSINCSKGFKAACDTLALVLHLELASNLPAAISNILASFINNNLSAALARVNEDLAPLVAPPPPPPPAPPVPAEGILSLLDTPATVLLAYILDDVVGAKVRASLHVRA